MQREYVSHTQTHACINHRQWHQAVFNMLKEIVRGIGFWQCAAEEGNRDGWVQDLSLKCFKSIHTAAERQGRESAEEKVDL